MGANAFAFNNFGNAVRQLNIQMMAMRSTESNTHWHRSQIPIFNNWWMDGRFIFRCFMHKIIQYCYLYLQKSGVEFLFKWLNLLDTILYEDIHYHILIVPHCVNLQKKNVSYCFFQSDEGKPLSNLLHTQWIRNIIIRWYRYELLDQTFFLWLYLGNLNDYLQNEEMNTA